MFFPYKMDSGAKGLPLIAVMICMLCIWVYWQQYSHDARYQKSIHNFCNISLDAHAYSTLKAAVPDISEINCFKTFNDIRESRSIDRKITALSSNAKPLGIFATREDDQAYLYNRILEHYRTFDATVPAPRSKDLAYRPGSLDFSRMMTATFSHSDVIQLFINVLFFYVFATAVELVIGNFMFAFFLAFSTIGTNLAYSYVATHNPNVVPTIGLSGLVMACIGALSTMIPFAQIRCFAWLVFIVRRFRLPAFFLATFYIFWEIHTIGKLGDSTFANYTVHISGAAIGTLFGFYYNLFEREKLQLATNHY